MADIAQIGFAVDTRGLERGNRELDRMQRKGGGVQRSVNGISKSTSNAAVAFRRLGSAIAAVGVVALARQVSNMADGFNLAQRLIGQYTDTQREANDVLQQLFELSQQNRQSFEQTARVYQRFRIATQSIGTSTTDLLDAISGLQKTIVLTGVSASEANAGMIQLAQGMASGRLQGDELRSVLESMPKIGQEIASVMGIAFADLRDAAAEGAVGVQDIIDALLNLNRTLDISGTAITVSEAFTQLGNSMLRFVGIADDGSSVSSKFARFISELSVSVDELTAYTQEVIFAIKAFAVVLGAKIFISFAGTIKDITIALTAMYGRLLPIISGAGIAAFTALVVKANAEGKTLKQTMDEVALSFRGFAEQLGILQNNQQFISGMNRQLGEMAGEIRESGGVAELSAEKINGLLDRLRELQTIGRSQFGVLDRTLASEEDIAQFEATMNTIENAIAALEQRLANLRGGTEITVTPGGISKEEQKAIDEYEKSLRAILDSADPMREALRQFNDQMVTLNKAVQNGDISWQEYNRAVQHIQDELKATQDRLTGMDRFMQQAGDSVDDYFYKFVDGTASASEALQGFIIQLARAAQQQLIFQATGGQTSSIGGFILDALGGLSGGGANPAAYRMQANPHAGFADGGSFMVGGQFPNVSAGRDNRLVSFFARDGEQVSVSTPGKSMGSNGVQVVNEINIDASGAEAGVEARIQEGIARALPQITQASLQRVVNERQRNPRLFGGR